MIRRSISVSTGGFTLVEIMIALALGSLILAGILQVFNANFKAYNLLNADGNIQESNRLARAIILKDIQNAGSLGCSKEQQYFINNDMLTDGTHPAFGLDAFAGGLGILNNVASGQKISDLSAYHTDNENRKVEGSTDVLSMIKATAITERLTGISGNQITLSGNAFNKNDYVIIMSCQGKITAEVFKVVDINQQTNQQVLTLNLSVQQDNKDLLDNNNRQSMSTSVYKLEAISYFVSEGVGSTTAEKRYSLFRKVNNHSSIEYISGIDDMQIDYEFVDASQSQRSFIKGASATTETMALANMVHLNFVLRSDSASTSAIFKGPLTGKTQGANYPDDGKLRRLAKFSGKVRSRF